MLLLAVLLIFVALAYGLVWYLVSNDHGEHEPIGALWFALAFGFAGAIAAGVIENAIIPAKNLTGFAPLSAAFITSLGIGVIEEACKFIPLAFFIYPRRYFNEHTDGVIYFALAGIGFGLPENILYSLQYGAKAGIGRIILTPVFHAATTAAAGYVLIHIKLHKQSKIRIVLALIGMMFLHGMYDFGLISNKAFFIILSVLITLGMSLLLIILYLRATDRDQSVGLSSVGHNSFCRTCGHPNPNHTLYCSQCGQRA